MQSHECQHARPPCPSPAPAVHLDSCPTLCNPMNHSTPGLPVHHRLLEFTQTHVHWVSDAIQPSHPLSSPSPPAPNPSQHQSFLMSQLFTGGGQSCWSFSFSIIPSKEIPGLISFRMDWLDLLAVQGILKSSPTPQFKSINSSALSLFYGPTPISIHECWKSQSFDYMDPYWQSVVSVFQYGV